MHAYDVRDAKEEHSQWNSFFLWGAVGEADVDVPKLCGAGRAAASMAVSPTFFTVVLTVVTLGVYSPQMAYVSCGEPAPAAQPQPEVRR